MQGDPSLSSLMTKLRSYLDDHPDRPWCVHEMWEEVGVKHPGEDMLVETQRALNHLARNGTIGSSGMMVERGEGVCDDWFYWSKRSGKSYLDEFGPPWLFPGLSDLIKSHCRHRV
jgi:hypothetical protein